MKSASAKTSTRSKAAAPKSRSRAAKTSAAVIKDPLAAAAMLSAAVEASFDEADTVVAAPVVAEPAAELSDEAYVAQLLAAAPAVVADVAVEPQIEEVAAVEVATVEIAPAIEIEQVAVAVMSDAVSSEAVDAASVGDAALHEEVPATEAVASAASILALPAQCLVRDTAQLQQSLLKHVAAAAVSIDTSAVERIDTAAMQVLLAFVRDRQSQQHVVEWLGLNEVFVDSAQLLGIDKLLGLPASGIAA